MSVLKNQLILITGSSGYMVTHAVASFLSVLTVWPTLRPLTNSTDNKRDLLKPAVNGTLNILDFVSKHVPQVKRIIFTSSFVAMIDIAKGRWPGHVYSEEDWNPATYEVVAAKDAPGALVYATAKTIMPPMKYGPNINVTASLASLNSSSADIYRLMSPDVKPSDPAPENHFFSVVDVRDVAEAHLRAYDQFVDALRENLPEVRDRVSIRRPGTGAVSSDVHTVDTSKSQRVLGLKYRELEETIVDAAKSLLELEEST
ncbi:uncharacterized protein ASPGLDRAFT_77179 [Aspergillus glaucus CBS 516.65]|uniref:3-beta hydroxysteroid dehydrogenase/isomerase domain-containing protein n=1 Tax=Aspergillus glaucus CBS 516.65 TaxID=1160497 RepID=A0A1L9V8L1_ASPGL|nr:hypothetical protein ASPGLDRAFT_77179 [Aspergillus glaucus CBS 516.65]OJJ80277.1 hypothetical protein ASPGLDRAFT_77179 [Aspergillus glaucus CBS 516.65]